VRDRVGHFRIVRQIGEGGMGIVFAAHDERLDRPVAIKMIRQAGQAEARERFWREARAAARLNHPNVCQIHDVGEVDGQLYIAMELLEGESLADRMTRGALSLEETGSIALGILAALEALHRHEIVHRDLKPSNVHLTPHGVKLLDFGLARPASGVTADGAARHVSVTQTGHVVGTPRYMSPEQWNAEPLGTASDLFSLGALLYEALTGVPPFGGQTPAEVRHAAVFDHPPALAGPPAIAAIDRLLRRAMAKSPGERYVSASAMAAAVRQALLSAGDATVERVRPVTRLAVLPFRTLRSDPDTDFLSLSLPDAITSSLAGFESLVVRSAWSAARFAGESPDLRAIAEEANVDLILLGSLLRGGDQLRVTAQLVEVPGETTRWSKAFQAPVGDVFALQDNLAREIVASLSLPLSGRERGSLQRDVPATARAYDLYLRANQAAQASLAPEGWKVAHDLYRTALEEDPNYAPAWAQLGRVYRLLAKYHPENAPENLLRAADAFRRALDLNPDLALAHNYQAAFEAERGNAVEIMARLIRRLQTQRTDPGLYGALVHCCRYAGLLHASAAADAEARRLDPNVRTSVAYTYWMLGDYDRVIAEHDPGLPTGYYLCMVGREAEALADHARAEATLPDGIMRWMYGAHVGALRRDAEVVERQSRRILGSSFRDPEGFYFLSRSAAMVGLPDLAVEALDRTVRGGYYADRAMAHDPWFDSMRRHPRFLDLYRSAEEGRHRAERAFRDSEGDKLLGLSTP
jgi:serine/threonine protein kinase/tetratricopeptide (TPR) repeat protein